MTTNEQVGTTTEKPRKVSFRNSTDIETFYRFIADNGLRREAKMVLEKISALMGKNNGKKKRKRRARVSKTLH